MSDCCWHGLLFGGVVSDFCAFRWCMLVVCVVSFVLWLDGLIGLILCFFV